ncbi:leucine-rich repeats and immunoglobulin-like domains protein 1 [Ptychodera flava]|uniref:leucine-rich repeats and immunoglobulin-like domains protein 1 n=1 Tax=Ptychodera flava TaxID=63121 RepID=UPI00396A3F59
MKMPFTESNFSFIACVLYWRLLSHPEVGAVTTTTSFPIASLNITPSDTVTVEGRDTQLNCSFHHVGSNVPAWKIYDGVRYIEVTSGATLHRDGYNATLDASSGEYHLIMRNATLALAGNYECSLLGSNIYHRAELVVLEYGPVCGVSPGHTVVSNQSESTFTCHVDGGSWGDLVWLKNGGEISRVSTSTNEYSTILQKTDNGAVYNCRYESQNISSHLWPQLTCIDDISVDVQYKPSIKDKDKETINVTKGSSVSLFCSADANPNAKITWKKESNDLGAIGDNGIYIISSVVEDDQGMYTCTAENYLGDDQREINLNVIFSSKQTANIHN